MQGFAPERSDGRVVSSTRSCFEGRERRGDRNEENGKTWTCGIGVRDAPAHSEHPRQPNRPEQIRTALSVTGRMLPVRKNVPRTTQKRRKDRAAISDTLTHPRTHAPLQVIVHFSEGEAKALAVLAGALGSDEGRAAGQSARPRQGRNEHRQVPAPQHDEARQAPCLRSPLTAQALRGVLLQIP